VNASPQLRQTCPQCRGTFYVREEQVGQVVTCPDCLEEFCAERPPPPSVPDEEPVASAPENQQRRPSAEGSLIDAPADLLEAASRGTLESPEPVEQDADYVFAVECPLCGTRLEVQSKQIGSRIKCPDCTSAVPVREPPPNKRRPPTGAAAGDEDGELRLSEPADKPAVTNLTRGILESAEREVLGQEPRNVVVPTTPQVPPSGASEDRESERASRPRQPKRLFFTGLMGFLFAPTTLPRWLGLAIALELEMLLFCKAESFFAAASASGSTFAAGGPAILAVICFVGAVLLGLFAVPVWSISMLTVLQASDDGKPYVEEWPGADFLDWFGDSLYVLAAAFVGALPGLFLGQAFLAAGLASSIYTSGVATCAGLSGAILFPVVLLSMMEGGSVLHVLTRPVFQSLRLAANRWLQFYGLVILSFACGAVIWQGRQLESWILDFLISFGVIGLSIVYFWLLGRLTWYCQEVVAEADMRAEEDQQGSDQGDAT
jgi:DNA-directed RNA polymerase subunit M/transcription elongation factor TFIIS